MRKPIHPDQRGWKKPSEYCRETANHQLDQYYRIDFMGLLKTWEEIKEDHRGRGQKIVEATIYLDRGNLIYDYEWKNMHYTQQLETYNNEVAKFLNDQIRYAEYESSLEENKKKNKAALLDAKIVRTERRLANLKATKEGVPLPYPTEKDDSLSL